MLLLLEHYTKVCLTECYVTSTRKGEKVAGWKVHEGRTLQLFSSSSSTSIISRRPQSSVTFDLRCFDCWGLSLISFNNPKSFKPGQYLGFKQKQAQFESISCLAGMSATFLLNSGSGLGSFRGHVTVLLHSVGAKFRVRGEGAVWPPKATGFSQADSGVVYVMWWLGFQIYVKMVGVIYAEMEGRVGTPRVVVFLQVWSPL